MQIHPLPGIYEPFSAISHLLGAVVFVGFGADLLRRGRGDARRVGLLAVYVVSAVLLLFSSGVYHLLPEGSDARAVLARLDLAAIFLLIAGTHTPVQGFFFRGWARWGVLALMWSVTVTGITLFAIYYDELPRGMKTGTYLMIGWIAGVSGLKVWRRYGFRSVRALVFGGIAYSLGAVILGAAWPTLIPGIIGPHELWHIAVLAGVWFHWRFFALHAQWPLDGPVPLEAPPARSRKNARRADD